ncbi:hypothetical protein NEMIN01_2450, partial [Nematocida minor]|uniref:uncharacterized protein n=1 Tax=Nematocida minor TaxID=1912983 RepID=UPI00222065CC
MREVKLVIDIKRIVEACLTMKSKNDMKADIECDNTVGRLAILKHMLKDNLKIEDSSYSADDNQHIIEAVENDICQCFIYRYPRVIIRLNNAINNKEKDEIIRSYAIELANELIELNPLVYNPEHGINRKTETVEKIKSDTSDDALGTRTCTLEIDDEKFFNLKSMAEYTAKSLDRYVLYSVSYFIDSMGMLFLKLFPLIKEYYTLDYLYAEKDEKTNLLLVDHGLGLIHKKYHKIREIIEKLKKVGKDDEAQKQSIIDELKGLFDSEEDFKVVLSIIKNIRRILNEKSVQKCMVDIVEYMFNNTNLLDKTDEKNALKLEKDLSNFLSVFIRVDGRLQQKVKERIAKLRAEKGASEAETKLIGWKLKKEESLLQDGIVFLQDNRHFLRSLSKAQVDYLYKKIKETLEAQNPKAKELEKPEEVVKAPEAKLNKIFQLLTGFGEQPEPEMQAHTPPHSPVNKQPPF